jgi:dihydropteroate synthase
MKLRVGEVTLDLQHAHVMGVLNVTPDSFSDGGRFFDTDIAVRHAEDMAADGVAIIDIGGESTRPGAAEVSVQQELDRVLPVIEVIASRIEVGISIDTSKPEVMIAAEKAGAGMINDVYALRRQGALEAAAATDCAICLMHMQGEPRDMQDEPTYDDVAAEVCDFLADRVAVCIDGGIAAKRILIDPGFGFGKADGHNIELLAKLERLQTIERPILVGLSRKRTLGNLTRRDADSREAAGVAAAVLAYLGGARIMRSHDVASTLDALAIVAAVNQWRRNGLNPEID